MIRINQVLGADYKADLDDVKKVKMALHALGFYKIPDYGMTPYPDASLFNAIKSFQSNEKLKVDGVIKPGGETIIALNKKSPNELPGVRRPDLVCPICGGFHGGVMGDLCPDCASK